MALILSTDVIGYHNDNYITGGIVTTFKDGTMCESYPFDLTNPVIYPITPITANISRLGNVQHVTANINAKTIRFDYGINCVVSGFNGESDSSYALVTLSVLIIMIKPNIYTFICMKRQNYMILEDAEIQK